MLPFTALPPVKASTFANSLRSRLRRAVQPIERTKANILHNLPRLMTARTPPSARVPPSKAMSNDRRLVPGFFSHLISSTGAGCASTLFGHPLDVLKTHQQTAARTVTSRGLFQQHGPSVFFRGIGPPLCSAVAMNAVTLWSFDAILQSLPLPEHPVSSLASGLVAGCLTACISTPADAIKIRAQLRGISSAAALRTLRPSTIFRGHSMNLCREGIFTMIYLGLYDIIRPKDYVVAPLHVIAAASSCTGALAWIASYPFDAVKTVMQSKGKHTLRSAVSILFQRGGVASFYVGCGSSTLRAVLVTSSRLVVYEQIRSWL
jgi:solute carrier family 25 carnitine/acylcarnitine transporter 20/29